MHDLSTLLYKAWHNPVNSLAYSLGNQLVVGRHVPTIEELK